MAGYVGNIPTPQATQTRDVFTATAGQTSFATSGYTPGFLDVYLNGVHLVNGTDYTASNGSDVVLSSGATAGDNLEVVSYSTFEVFGQTFTGNSTFTGDVLIADKIVHDGDTNTAIRFPAADTVTVETAGSERVRVDASGNIVKQYGTAYQSITSGGSTSHMLSYGTWNGTPNLLVLGNTFDGIVFATGGGTLTEKARFDISGSLLVGTTTPATTGTHTFTSVSSSASTFALAASHTASNGDVRGILSFCPNYSGDDGYFFIGNRSGSDRIYIRTSGNVQNTNNSYGAISDVKLKENVIDATPKLDKLNQVRVVNYNLIGDEQKQIGVIAQELEQIFPSMVEESPDRDAEGNDLGTTTKSVKYSVFVPMLIKAMQEQQAIIEGQTAALQEALADIATLKAEVAALKGEPA